MTMRPPSDVAVASLIAAGGGRVRYDGIAMMLHWLTTLLVLTLFGLAEVWRFVPRPIRHVMIVAHMSCGILLTLVLVVRIAWRLTPNHKVADATAGWVGLASKAVHYGLYGLLAAEAVLGFLGRWSGTRPLSFIGLPIPSPFTPFSKPAHRLVGGAHDWIAWTIILLAAGHASAALFRHFVLRDEVLWRMLPGRRSFPSLADRRRKSQQVAPVR
jgi:cytochrome b561